MLDMRKAIRAACQQSFHDAIRSEQFLEFTRQRLCPQLNEGDIVVLDKLKPHHAAVVREGIEAVGAELVFLPPCSPDL
jgi:transposase